MYAENYVDGVWATFGIPYIIMKLRLTREGATLNKDRVTPESLFDNPESLKEIRLNYWSITLHYPNRNIFDSLRNTLN